MVQIPISEHTPAKICGVCQKPIEHPNSLNLCDVCYAAYKQTHQQNPIQSSIYPIKDGVF